MKIAVLGTKGMLAHVMIDILSETNDVTGISLRDKEFNELKLDGYDVVINYLRFAFTILFYCISQCSHITSWSLLNKYLTLRSIF